MKNIIKCIFLITIIFLPLMLFSDPPAPLQERTAIINFQGVIVDAQGASYDGAVDVEAWFYRTPSGLPADLVYAEEFAGVNVDHGMFRVPLGSGTPLEGTSFSIDDLASENSLYVDIKVDGTTLLETWSLNSALAAVRAERAVTAQALRQPLDLSPGDIPIHSVDRITTGHVDLARLPLIPAAKVTSGQFLVSMVPDMDAGKITSGTLSQEAFSSVPANLFTTGTLADAVIPSEILRTGDIGVLAGMAPHGTAVGIPSGFTRTQCMWMVSLRRFNEDAGGGTGIDHIEVVTDYNGVVSCRWDHVTATPLNKQCTANYITICKK